MRNSLIQKKIMSPEEKLFLRNEEISLFLMYLFEGVFLGVVAFFGIIGKTHFRLMRLLTVGKQKFCQNICIQDKFSFEDNETKK